jgi:hypothetical protein
MKKIWIAAGILAAGIVGLVLTKNEEKKDDSSNDEVIDIQEKEEPLTLETALEKLSTGRREYIIAAIMWAEANDREVEGMKNFLNDISNGEDISDETKMVQEYYESEGMSYESVIHFWIRLERRRDDVLRLIIPEINDEKVGEQFDMVMDTMKVVNNLSREVGIFREEV